MGKFFKGLLNIYAWVWNHLWGTLFMVGGVAGLFNGTSIWICILSIGVGVYFFTTKRFDAKVGAAASKVASLATAVVVERVNKEHNAEIDRDVATPETMTSSAQPAEVMSALDAILGATWRDSYHNGELRASERTADRVVYTFRTAKVPEAVKAEVRVGERDGATHVVFRCLHQDESNGLRSFAQLAARLRESVEYAVGAAGDPSKVAEGVRLYGPPEPGSPAAMKARNVKIAGWVGLIICAIPLYQLTQGIPYGELPQWIALEAVGVAVVYAVIRWAKGPITTRVTASPAAAAPGVPAEFVAPAAAAAPAVPAASVSGGGLDRFLGTLSTALDRFVALDGRNKILIGCAALAVLLVFGFAISNSGSNGYSGSGAPDDYYESDSGTVVDSAPEADVSEADAPVEDNASDPSLTRNGNLHYMGAEDVTYFGPTDGSSKHAMVTFVGGTGYSEAAGFEIDDISLGGEDPSQVWDVEVDSTQMGECFVNDDPVPVDEFLTFINGRAESLGGIDFTSTAIVAMKAYSDDFHPSGGY